MTRTIRYRYKHTNVAPKEWAFTNKMTLKISRRGFFIVDHEDDLQCCNRFYDKNAKRKITIFIEKSSEDKNVNKMYIHR